MTRIYNDIFESLAAQFPICMSSDEFHYFPQFRASSFDWSRWDDFSSSALASILERMAGWENALEVAQSREAGSDAAIDADMLLRIVRTLREQFALVRIHEQQPTFYLTIAGIGLAEAAQTGTEALNARLHTLADFIQQAMGNLKRVPRLFRDLGTDMLVKQQRWLQSLPLTDHDHSSVHDAYQHLDDHLRRLPVVEDGRVSVEQFEQIAFHHMGCRLAADDIAWELKQELEETRSILMQCAQSLLPGRPWQVAIDQLPQPSLPPGGLTALYRCTIAELADHCVRQGILTKQMLQQCPVTVATIPEYMQPVRSNAAYSMPLGHPPSGGTFYLLDDDDRAPKMADYRLLAAHETFPGHHLLDTCRWYHRRPVRRHIEFPLFYEGWASFAEELMFETGLFAGTTDRMLMAKRRFWRAMRGQADFELHMRRTTAQQTVAKLAAEGMAPQRAKAMVRRYRLKPGYQLAYTIGRRKFRRLYDAIPSQAYKPVTFAQQVLAQGQIGFHELEQALRQGG